MNRQFAQHRVAVPDEHSAVPVVPAGFDESVGQGLVRLFVKAQDLVRAIHAQRIAAMNVAQTGVAVGRHDSECDQRTGPIADDLERRIQALLKYLDGLDDVIGGDDGADRIRIALVENGRGKPNGVGRVPAHRLAQKILPG